MWICWEKSSNFTENCQNIHSLQNTFQEMNSSIISLSACWRFWYFKCFASMFKVYTTSSNAMSNIDLQLKVEIPEYNVSSLLVFNKFWSFLWYPCYSVAVIFVQMTPYPFSVWCPLKGHTWLNKHVQFYTKHQTLKECISKHWKWIGSLVLNELKYLVLIKESWNTNTNLAKVCNQLIKVLKKSFTKNWV